MEQYLTEDEQYQKSLSLDEIRRIKDYRLQKIRERYWNLRHQAFMDEHGIPDWELGKVLNRIYDEEAKALEEYKKSLLSNEKMLI